MCFYRSSYILLVERQKGLTTSHLQSQLDPFASQLMMCKEESVLVDGRLFHGMFTSQQFWVSQFHVLYGGSLNTVVNGLTTDQQMDDGSCTWGMIHTKLI